MRPHLAYLALWRRKLHLTHVSIGLQPFPDDGVTAGAMQYRGKGRYTVWINASSLRSPVDWQDTIRHELLHIAIKELRKPCGRFPMVSEEVLVLILSPLLGEQ